MGLSTAGPLVVTITDELAGRPVAEVAAALLGLAAAEVLERGGAWLGRRRVSDPDEPVIAGMVLRLHRPPGGRYAELSITADAICYEDAWLIALAKQPGWYTGPTPWDTRASCLAAMERFLAARDGRAPALHLAHQLDRDTSGVLLATKDPAANGLLQAAFAGGGVAKRYCCICAGEPAADSFEVRGGHGRSSGGRWRIYDLAEVGAVLPGGGRVKLAHTSFRVLRRLGDAAVLEALPHTGRTHQIRLHLAAAGHPLLGDTRYGGPASYRGQALPGHLLHAGRLSLRHPITGAPLELSAPPPPSIAAFWH